MSTKRIVKCNTNFTHNLKKLFSRIRERSEFYDVTLVCRDSKKVSAHKLILAAFSEYFRKLFKGNNLQNSTFQLSDLSRREVGNLLDFIYTGQAKLQESEVFRFLEIGERFKVIGIYTREVP